MSPRSCNIRPINPITEVNGYAVNGYYEAFEVNDDARQAFIESFATPEQRAWNATRQQCPTCKGWGYARTKTRHGHIDRENMGCETCGGLGTLPKASSNE